MATDKSQAAPYVFLSYASVDRERALQIANLLEGQGIPVWIDRKNIPGGTSWTSEIVRGIRGCATFLVACSPGAAVSPNVWQEVQLAWENRRPLLPVLLEPTELPETMEYALAGRQWIKVLDRPDDAWLVDVLGALRALGEGSRAETPGFEPSQSLPTPTLASQVSPSRHNLPAQLTNFIGREREIADVKGLLGTTRLLTLTGTGGCGKTRLALQVAVDLVDEHRDGVWLVELATIAYAGLVAGTVAAALGVRERQGQPIEATLLSFLRTRRLLLLLDNCEHLIDDCARLADALLRGCPEMRLLATSREALGITGEVSWLVPSLSVSRLASDPSPMMLADSEAVRLFVDRARLVQSTFTLTEQNVPVVAQICERLDGIPLAIELAAARVKALSVEQIAARLDQRFRLLTGGSRVALPRQQTLAALVGWSYDLLTEPERVLFNRLSVFMGGFTLEAAEAVCGDVEDGHQSSEDEKVWPRGLVPGGGLSPVDLHESINPPDVLDLLTELVGKSLVISDSGVGGVERYRLLETLRQFGREKLVASGEADAMYQRHATYYRYLTEELSPQLIDGRQLSALSRLDDELGNVRTALQWSVDTMNAHAGLGLVTAMEYFWYFRGLLKEGLAWMESFLALPSLTDLRLLQARTLAIVGYFQWSLGDRTTARARLEQSRAIAQELGDSAAEATALIDLGAMASSEEAELIFEECLRLYRKAGDDQGAGESLLRLARNSFNLGNSTRADRLLAEVLAMARRRGDRRHLAFALEIRGEGTTTENAETAQADLEESLRLYRELGDQGGVVTVENFLGRLDVLQGRFRSARDHYVTSLRSTRDWLWVRRITQSLDGLAMVAAGLGDPERALRLTCAYQRDEASSFVSPQELKELESVLAPIRLALGETRVADLRSEGQAMNLEQAIAYALEDDEG